MPVRLRAAQQGLRNPAVTNRCHAGDNLAGKLNQDESGAI
jgi:hypothetical protein